MILTAPTSLNVYIFTDACLILSTNLKWIYTAKYQYGNTR